VLYAGKQAEMPAGRMALEPLRFATSFVGRAQEVDELVEAVKRDRFVTLIGMGGIGKTRLADAAARRLSDAFDDGTYFIELATTADTEPAVVSTLLTALEIDTAGFSTGTAALVAHLRHRHVLLVLDNFEAVTTAADLVGRVYLECPRLHLLITSQRPLNIDGEHIRRTEPMETAAVGGWAAFANLDAYKLFRERANARVAGWQPKSPAEEAVVIDILRLTEGIPLSIELAAAWVDGRTLTEIRAGLTDRLALLTRRRANSVGRHHSTQACLDYSFGLLPSNARELLPKLSVLPVVGSRRMHKRSAKRMMHRHCWLLYTNAICWYG